jgi:hypothetical protein
MLKRIREGLRSRDESSKLADIALRDEIAAFDLISSLGSADKGVRETASKAIVEVARRDADKLLNTVLHWSGDRHYKMNAFLKWTDGLESKNLVKVRQVLGERIKSATLVDQLINEYDSVNEKNDKLREFFAQKKVTQQAFERLRKEYDEQLCQATKKLLAQFLVNSHQLEELSKTRSKIKDDMSVLETRATLGDIGRKESENLRAESSKLLDEIQEKDRKLTEELSVMLLSSGPIKIYDENGKIVAVASEFHVDRDNHTVELKSRVIADSDLLAVQMMDNRSALIALIYNITIRSPQDSVLTSDKLTTDVIEKVAEVVASELKVSSEEALHIDKLRYFLELTSWKSPKARIAVIPTQGLNPSERGFVVKAGAIKVEEAQPVEVKPVELRQAEIRPTLVEKLATPKPAGIAEPPTQPMTREKAEVLPEPMEAKPAEKPGAMADQELQQEVESMKAMLDEDENAKKAKPEKTIETLDDKVLTEIDKAAEKLRQRMKSR